MNLGKKEDESRGPARESRPAAQSVGPRRAAEKNPKRKRTWKRRLLTGFGVSVLGLLCVGASADSCVRAPAHAGLATDHFDGEKFFNEGRSDPVSFRNLPRMMFDRPPRGPWDEWREYEPEPVPPERVEPGAIRATFINHATVLVQMDGLNILTDPVYSERCSPVTWSGPKRHHAPGVRFEDLPPIDVVVLSHNHYDHTDEATIRRLLEEHDPKFVVGLGQELYLETLGVERSEALEWGDATSVGAVRIISQRTSHFSGRGLTDRNETLWAAYVLEGPSGRVYFAGDTAYDTHFAETGERFDGIDLALLPIGAYRPRSFMRDMHVNPDEAVRAHRDLQSNLSIAIHFGTFNLAAEGQDEPIADLEQALSVHGVPADDFVVLTPGKAVTTNGESKPRPPEKPSLGDERQDAVD